MMSDSRCSLTSLLFCLHKPTLPLFSHYKHTSSFRRSFDDGSDLAAEVDPSELPLLNTILEAKDFTALLSPHCQRKLFCEITKIGENEEASFMQRAFYYLAML